MSGEVEQIARSVAVVLDVRDERDGDQRFDRPIVDRLAPQQDRRVIVRADDCLIRVRHASAH
jgi:hypothetical protein